MAYKDPEVNRAYQRAWQADRSEDERDAKRIARRARVNARIEWLHSLKNNPCMDCGGTFPPCAMDFDHREAESKEQGICQMVRGGWSRERILAEIAKCDLVCANCHRIRTHLVGS